MTWIFCYGTLAQSLPQTQAQTPGQTLAKPKPNPAQTLAQILPKPKPKLQVRP